jgi:hypothetical protein
MSAATDRINALLPRILPVVLGVVIVSFGYYWVLEPGIADVLRNRVEVRTLAARVRVLEERTARGGGIVSTDQDQAISLFEQRVSKEDRVADVGERLIRAVAESATDGKLRNLVMGTGDPPAAGLAGQVRQVAAGEVETVDPRWSLFPYRLTHTPVTLSFDASYGTIARFFSKIRDLPTAVEIRSVKLTRGLPLMSAQLTVFVFRRGDLVAGAGAAGSLQPTPGASQVPEPAGPPANPLVPRVVEPRGPGG